MRENDFVELWVELCFSGAIHLKTLAFYWVVPSTCSAQFLVLLV